MKTTRTQKATTVYSQLLIHAAESTGCRVKELVQVLTRQMHRTRTLRVLVFEISKLYPLRHGTTTHRSSIDCVTAPQHIADLHTASRRCFVVPNCVTAPRHHKGLPTAPRHHKALPTAPRQHTAYPLRHGTTTHRSSIDCVTAPQHIADLHTASRRCFVVPNCVTAPRHHKALPTAPLHHNTPRCDSYMS